MPKQIRTIVVEDEELYRDLLVTSLGASAHIEVVGSFSNGSEALRHIADLLPDVAILDINLGERESGVDVGLQIRQLSPQIGIVLLSHYDQPGVLEIIPRHQVSGWCYLLKGSVSNLQVILHTIEAASRGLMVLDPELVRAFEPKPRSRVDGLTARQREILALIAQGYSNIAIAQSLGVTLKSVENYITQLYQELGIEANQDGVHGRVSATLAYLSDRR